MAEDLKKRMKGLFNKLTNEINSATGQSFKGTGHRLGGESTSSAAPAKSPVHGRGAGAPGPSGGSRAQPQQVPSQQQAPGARAGGAAAAAAAAEQRLAAAAARGAPGHRTGAGGAGGRPAASPKPPVVMLPAAEFDPFQPAVGGGAALSAIRDPPPQALSSASSIGSAGALASGGSAAPPGRPPQSAGPPPTADQVDDMRRCVALLLSLPPAHAAASVDILGKLLGNLLARPEEPRFRQVRLGNPRIREAVADAPGGCELLAACGFTVHRDDGDAEGGFAAFLEDEKLPLVEEGLLQLQSLAAARLAAPAPAPSAMEARAAPGRSLPQPLPPPQQQQQQQQQPPGAAEMAAAAETGQPPAAPQPLLPPAAAAVQHAPAPPADRRLQIILPVASEIDLDESFFERTPADVKAEYARLVARRRAGEVLTTRAHKEAQRAAASGPAPKDAAVRVRFPEGVQLSAMFGTSEPLARVHEAVAAALRNPGALFELVLPDRRPLPRAGRVADAGIAPAVLLNFRPLLEGPPGRGGGGRGPPSLSDEMLRLAQVD